MQFGLGLDIFKTNFHHVFCDICENAT